MTKVKHVSLLRWQVFLIIFAVYQVVHFCQLLPFAPDIVSNQGIIPHANELPTYPFFPNILFILDDPWVVYALVGVLIGCAVLFPIPRYTLITSLVLYYGWTCILTRNPFVRNPGMPYVGWMLLAIAVITWWNKRESKRSWHMPAPIFWWAWFFLALGYTLSGLHKLGSPSWQEGLALSYLFENPLSRPGLISSLLQQSPDIVMKLNTWGALALETLAFPLMLVGFLRPWVWLALIFMHVGIMLTVDFVDLTMGMLLIHLFVFDERWLKRKGDEGILFFDGVCNLCNHFIDTIVGMIDQDTLKIAPLQGETAQKELAGKSLPDSIIYYRGDVCLEKSDAVIAIGERIGGFHRLCAIIIRMIPRSIRDWGYDFVARNRYKIFGEKDTCRLPTKEEQDLFLP